MDWERKEANTVAAAWFPVEVETENSQLLQNTEAPHGKAESARSYRFDPGSGNKAKWQQ